MNIRDYGTWYKLDCYRNFGTLKSEWFKTKPSVDDLERFMKNRPIDTYVRLYRFRNGMYELGETEVII